MSDDVKVPDAEELKKYEKKFNHGAIIKLIVKLKKKIKTLGDGLLKSTLNKVTDLGLHLLSAYDNPATPMGIKAACVAPLAYFLSPFDLVPDMIPIVGYADDIGVMAAVVAMVSSYSTYNPDELDAYLENLEEQV